MMKSALKSFVFVSLALGIVLSCAFFYVWEMQMINSFYPSAFAILFVMSLTILFHFYLLKISNGNAKLFFGKFIGSSGIKLMIYLLTIVLFIFLIPGYSKTFLITFLISYVLFSFTEIFFILKFLKK
jgi:hypothetical protein